MSQLDTRKLEILRKMGVDVWSFRDTPVSRQSELDSVVSANTEKVLSQSDQHVSGASEAEQLEMPELDSVPVPDLTLDSIADRIRSCDDCALSKTRSNAVPGHGCVAADWVFVGEAPGREEDSKGLPFAGNPGKMLDSMIGALGLDRSAVFITNGVKCRPPDNRDPLPEEISQCSHYLKEQLEVLKPKVIVALGCISAHLLLDTKEPMQSLRQISHSYGDRKIPLIATYHPAHLLRDPGHKRDVWEDLLMARSLTEP